MASRIEIELPDEALDALDRAIDAGAFPDRATALVEGLRRILDSSRIAAAYEVSYAAHPEDERYGNSGLRLLADRVGELRGERWA